MRRIHDPVDARAARASLRIYALALPALSLVGGWCTLLQIAAVIAPEIVAHIPEAVKIAALFGAMAWLGVLLHAVHRLPGVIDDILERGLLIDDDSERRF